MALVKDFEIRTIVLSDLGWILCVLIKEEGEGRFHIQERGKGNVLIMRRWQREI